MINRFFSRQTILSEDHPFLVYGGILIMLNALLIGMYFSGISWMQQIVAPTIEGLQFSQWREFGLMEMIQNALLLGVILLFISALLLKDGITNKVFYSVGLAIFAFLFLEEIDYGLHYAEYVFGVTPSGIETRNWHNQWNDGVENATKLKKLNDAANIIWFFLVPLLMLLKPVRTALRRLPLIPTGWFVLSVLIAVLFARLAHYLDDNGFAMINGYHGNLHQTIAEFRETSLYYIYLVYARQLIKLERLILPAR